MAAFSAGRPKESKPNGAEHGLALHGLVADDQVTEGVVADVALVRRPRGVGVHAQRVELLPRVVVVDLVGALVVPVALPLALDRFDVVRACHATRVGEGGGAPVRSGGGRTQVGRTVRWLLHAADRCRLQGRGGLGLGPGQRHTHYRGATGQRHHEDGHRKCVMGASDPR